MKTIFFDAYGTLLDVHTAVRRHIDDIGPDFAAFSTLWRAKQLEYTWIRTLTGAYVDFWTLTQDALDFTLDAYPHVDRTIRNTLLDTYLALECFPDVPDALAALRDAGWTLAVLSNGSPLMLVEGLHAAGVRHLLDEVFSVDPTKRYKTHPEAYAVYCSVWDEHPSKFTFVSSNRWDLAGAHVAGFKTVWLNRAGLPDEYRDQPVDARIGSLDELIGVLAP